MSSIILRVDSPRGGCVTVRIEDTVNWGASGLAERFESQVVKTLADFLDISPARIQRLESAEAEAPGPANPASAFFRPERIEKDQAQILAEAKAVRDGSGSVRVCPSCLGPVAQVP